MASTRKGERKRRRAQANGPAAVGKGRTPNIMNAVELEKKRLRKLELVIPALLSTGLAVLAGKPKLGKSWLGLIVADGITRTGQVLGHPVVKGEVLLLALEDGERRLQRRLRLLRQGEPPFPLLHLATQWPRLDQGGLERLDEWLTEHPKARGIIIDTFAKVRRRPKAGEAANAYYEEHDALIDLKTLADRHRVFVLLVHHTRKAPADDRLDEVLGTTAFSATCDVIWLLKRSRSSSSGTLFVTGRDIEEVTLNLSFDGSAGTWRTQEEGHVDPEQQTRVAIQRVLRGARKPLTPKQIAEALGRNRSTIRGLLRKMAEAGQVTRIGGGKYTVASR